MTPDDIYQKLLTLSQTKFNALVKFCRQNDFWELEDGLKDIAAHRQGLIKRVVDFHAEDLSACGADCFLRVLSIIFNETENQCLEKFDKTKLFTNPEDTVCTDVHGRITYGYAIRKVVHYNLKYLIEQMEFLLKQAGYNILEFSDTVPVKLLKKECVFLMEGGQGPASHYKLAPLSSYGGYKNVSRIYIKNTD